MVNTNTVRAGLAALALAGLTACVGLSLDTANTLRNLDFLNDDIAAMTIAFDLPVVLAPVPGASTLNLDATTRDFGGRHIEAVLERGDATTAVSSLPAPANGRAYYLLVLAKNDRGAIREFQKWARDLKAVHGELGGELTLNVAPAFCRTASADVSKARFSVLISLPGERALAPLLSNIKLGDAPGAANAGEVPLCAVAAGQ